MSAKGIQQNVTNHLPLSIKAVTCRPHKIMSVRPTYNSLLQLFYNSLLQLFGITLGHAVHSLALLSHTPLLPHAQHYSLRDRQHFRAAALKANNFHKNPVYVVLTFGSCFSFGRSDRRRLRLFASRCFMGSVLVII